MFAEPWQAQAFALAVTLSEQRPLHLEGVGRALADELRPPPSAASPTTARTTTSTGWPRWSGS